MSSKNSNKKHIAVLISGKGGLLKTLINKKPDNIIIDIVLSSSNKSVEILNYAKNYGIYTDILDNVNISENIWKIISQHKNIDCIILLGFLKLLEIPKSWEKKVINLHPSLLPKYGGKGMYGK